MIHIFNKGNIKKILIENSIRDDSDIELLHKELSSSNGKISVEITFIDTKSIPAIIVKELSKIKKRATIITTQRSLWLYLSKLGIKSTYKNNFIDSKSDIKEPLKAIVLGGSAGSVEKIIDTIKSIHYCDISIFVVIHILPNKQSHLCEILQKHTNYKVYEAKHNTKVRKSCIYISPPDYHMIITNNIIYLNQDDKVNHSRPSIDITFKSLSYEYQSALLAILFCGYGKDGSLSLKDLKQNNCEIIIEDPRDCEAKDMLLNAIKTDNYTKILNLKQIEHFIKSSLDIAIDIKDEIDKFLENIYMIYGYDFRHYDKNSLIRRINLTMKNSGIKEFKEFERMIFDDEKLFDKLVRSFSINVTDFFRNPLIYKTIREQLVPYLESFPSIRIWCAGCSRGDEPYSIAIMLDEVGLLHKSQIYATDFNTTILDEAENGLFPKDEYKSFESNYIKSGGKENFRKWFDIEKKEDFMQIKQNIRNKVLFFKHNLATDSSINEFNLVFCRNVLIYFDRVLQKKVFKTIDDSLCRNSFLVLGESELIDKKYNYKVVGNKKDKIYKKEI